MIITFNSNIYLYILTLRQRTNINNILNLPYKTYLLKGLNNYIRGKASPYN